MADPVVQQELEYFARGQFIAVAPGMLGKPPPNGIEYAAWEYMHVGIDHLGQAEWNDLAFRVVVKGKIGFEHAERSCLVEAATLWKAIRQ